MTFLFPEEPGLTRAEQSIMEYISREPESFLFMSIGQLADRLGVSDATISRFAKHVGCKDYKHLKQLVMEQNMTVGPAGKLAGTLFKEDSAFSVDNWMVHQQYCIEKTMENLSMEAFEDAVSAILSARRIYIHAKNASISMAELLYFRLRRLGLDVRIMPSGGSEVLEGLMHTEKEDVVIMFSLSKVSREGKIILDYAKTVGYKTIAFSGNIYSHSEQQADVNLYVYRGESMEYHSMASPSALVDALVVALSERLGEKTVERLTKIRKLKDIYN